MTENQTPTPAALRALDAERLAEIRERYSRTGPVNAYYEPPAQTMFADVLALLDRLAAAEQELAELRARAEADKPWNTAVDWLLNSRHTGDPDIQAAFWLLADGHITRDDADRGYKDEIELVEYQKKIEAADV